MIADSAHIPGLLASTGPRCGRSALWRSEQSFIATAGIGPSMRGPTTVLNPFSFDLVDHNLKSNSRMDIEGKDRRHWYGAGCLMH
jgi:hypothetical protein